MRRTDASTPVRRAPRLAALAFAAALTFGLASCISIGPKAPEQLLTLTPTALAPAGTDRTGTPAGALAVHVPSAAQRLNVTRVPVQLSDSSIAYLENAMWVEKPTQLFRNLLAETIRARGTRLVVSGNDELQYAATTQLSGQLVEMGYDAAGGSVTVRFDAVLAMPDGALRTRRFESIVPGVAPLAEAVAPALNQAANQVAGEIADWVG